MFFLADSARWFSLQLNLMRTYVGLFSLFFAIGSVLAARPIALACCSYNVEFLPTLYKNEDLHPLRIGEATVETPVRVQVTGWAGHKYVLTAGTRQAFNVNKQDRKSELRVISQLGIHFVSGAAMWGKPDEANAGQYKACCDYPCNPAPSLVEIVGGRGSHTHTTAPLTEA